MDASSACLGQRKLMKGTNKNIGANKYDNAILQGKSPHCIGIAASSATAKHANTSVLQC